MAERDRIPRILFAGACLFFAFLYGFVSSHFGWFPHSFMSGALNEIATACQATPANSIHHKYPARHDLVGAASYPNPDPTVPQGHTEIQQGITLLTSYWPESNWLPGLRVIDLTGRTLHHWTVDVKAIWPACPHQDAIAGSQHRADNYVHGSYLFENGDVLFNVEYLGLVRMDASGKVLWRLDGRTDHSIHRADDGNFWVCASTWIVDPKLVARFPGLDNPVIDDRAILVSPQGKILREVSILEVLFASKHRPLLWTTQFANITYDRTHLNDVEPLSPSMAGEYPLFAAGDLLISLRNINLVFVLDPETKRIKWSAPGQFCEQHDPDFIGDGWISVFDNNGDGTIDGGRFGGSRLVAVRPHTGETRQIYPRPYMPRELARHERRFYSLQGGKAQYLPNGNWLITEASAGRVFEIDKDGRTVWEWGHFPHDDGMISEVLEGTRYPLASQTVRRWSQ